MALSDHIDMEAYDVVPRATYDRLREALEKLATLQPEAYEVIRSNGFVFDDIGREPGNWKHLAFTLYTYLCEVDSISRAAIGKEVGIT